MVRTLVGTVTLTYALVEHVTVLVDVAHEGLVPALRADPLALLS